MPFQDIPNKILWKIHFSSAIEKVYDFLTTDEGRKKFWAKETKESNGFIEFNISNYPIYTAKIIEQKPQKSLRLEYFGTDVNFELCKTKKNGTDLILTALTKNKETKYEMTAGWVSVLMAMKAAVDFDIDLRNHNSEKSWKNGFIDN